jgi:hypothetical protein
LAAAPIPARRDARVRSPREYGAPSRSRAQTGDGDDPVTATRAAAEPPQWLEAIIEFFNEVADLKLKEKQTTKAAQADGRACGRAGRAAATPQRDACGGRTRRARRRRA